MLPFSIIITTIASNPAESLSFVFIFMKNEKKNIQTNIVHNRTYTILSQFPSELHISKKRKRIFLRNYFGSLKVNSVRTREKKMVDVKFS